MKNLIAAALMLAFATFASAQAPTATAPANTTTTTTTTTAPAAPKMEKKHRMGHKPVATSATTGTATTGTNAPAPAQVKMKHGEGKHHSKRTLAEQQAAAAKSAARDKVVSKDAEGHDIHLGPNGGQYYINKEGTKTYLKGSAKMKVN